jgi:hypothetical protein
MVHTFMLKKKKPYWVMFKGDEGWEGAMPVSRTLAEARKSAGEKRKEGSDRVVILKYVEERP